MMELVLAELLNRTFALRPRPRLQGPKEPDRMIRNQMKWTRTSEYSRIRLDYMVLISKYFDQLCLDFDSGKDEVYPHGISISESNGFIKSDITKSIVLNYPPDAKNTTKDVKEMIHSIFCPGVIQKQQEMSIEYNDPRYVTLPCNNTVFIRIRVDIMSISAENQDLVLQCKIKFKHLLLRAE